MKVYRVLCGIGDSDYEISATRNRHGPKTVRVQNIRLKGPSGRKEYPFAPTDWTSVPFLAGQILMDHAGLEKTDSTAMTDVLGLLLGM